MNKLLHIETPIITSYPRNANFIAMLSGQHPYFEDWLLMNHIQLASTIDEKQNFWIYFYEPLSRQYHPLLNKQELQKETFVELKIDLISFLTTNLDKNFYIYLSVDTYYISAYSNPTEHYAHDLFIYGYSITENIFYIADFFENGKYSFRSASFKEIENAFHSQYPEKNVEFDSIQLLSLNSSKKYIFDVPYFKKMIEDYLHSNKTFDTYRLIDSYAFDHTFGMNVYDVLTEQLITRPSNASMIKALHVVSDHKKLMLKRIQYLYEHKIINDENLYYLFEKVYRLSLVMRNSSLKNLISGLDLSSQIKYVKELKEQETHALCNLLASIKLYN
ncbi:hypothetical protein BS614_26310 [Paenibacillus xylanexedens]|uniref:DUF3986 family protein n=1 Tax=Paenibacillus xylanexedens TaxID=528191 RepID=UPI0009387A08|nr:DUF3986 family protein [Paenibacillus xylanexedens]APO47216.1 hypothetical protein BS614_26310 [Paenibacillus xylanexedens]